MAEVAKVAVDKSAANLVAVTEIKEFFAREEAFSRIVRAGGMNNGVAPTEEAKAARAEAIKAEVERTGFHKSKAGNTSITATGDLKIFVSAQDLADVKALAAKDKLTYSKDYSASVKQPDGTVVKVEHKAGDKRTASATALLLRNNENAVGNTKSGKTGLGAVELGEKGKGAFNYFNVPKLLENAEKTGYPQALLAALKEATAATKGTQAKIQILAAKAREATKAKGGAEMGA